MQLSEATALHKSWGNRPCSHPRLEKEYYLGMATGDYVCTTCGQSGWGSNWNEKERQGGDKPGGDGIA